MPKKKIQSEAPAQRPPLDQLLLTEEGFCRPVPAASITNNILRMDWIAWCYRHAIYQYPTLETINVLQGLTYMYPPEDILEIGAGNGHVGKLLGCRMTDSGIQDTHSYRKYYKSLGQSATCPPPCVERIEAIAAVRKYKPRAVIGCWITHAWKDGMRTGHLNGVEEELILAEPSVVKYIHLGNLNSHSEKPILKVPEGWVFEFLKIPGFLTRSQYPECNIAQIWTRLL